ncbi:thioredoxin family protein [Weeksellaceae bacterium TAE3-ERU29]|nr:thioredoxin family protein [Weeksellaceae bacterium TAE3-ERU29]
MGLFNFFKSDKKIKAVEINEQNFNQEIAESSQPILLDFYATWCQPCQVMHSLVNRMVKENQDLMQTLKVAKVDIDANPKISRMFGIQSVPTLLFIYDKKVLDKHNGLIPYQNLVGKCKDFAEDFIEE